MYIKVYKNKFLKYVNDVGGTNVAGKGRTFTNKVQPHCENKAYQERLTSSAREGEGERERETKKDWETDEDWETEKEREEIDR